MDATSVQSVIARIRDMEGTRFVATGFGKPVVEITVTAADGKTVEHVELSRSGQRVHRPSRWPSCAVRGGRYDDRRPVQKYVGTMKVYVPPPPDASTSEAHLRPQIRM